MGEWLKKTLEISSLTQVWVNLRSIQGKNFSENKKEKRFLLKQFAITTYHVKEAGLSLLGAHIDITFFSLISWFHEEKAMLCALSKCFPEQPLLLAAEKDRSWGWAHSIRHLPQSSPKYIFFFSFLSCIQSQRHQNKIIPWFSSNVSGVFLLFPCHPALFSWQLPTPTHFLFL